MPDLTTQIRATLDAWAKPTAIIEMPRALSPEQYAKFVQAWKDAHTGPETHRLKVIEPGAPVEPDPVPFDRMRDALLAVLDEHNGDDEGHLCPAEIEGYSVQRWHNAADPCPTMLAIAGKLGIEAHDD